MTIWLFSCVCSDTLRCEKCGFWARSTHDLEVHKEDIHGEKVLCGVCLDFVFPKSCWRLYRDHHRQCHPEQDFVEHLPLGSTRPVEDWEIPPEGGFLEVGSPDDREKKLDLTYSSISSAPFSPLEGMKDEDLYSPLSSCSESETVLEVDVHNSDSSEWETIVQKKRRNERLDQPDRVHQ